MIRQGFAKGRFVDTYQRTPWHALEKKEGRCWPLLDFLFTQQRISYLDYVLIHQMFRKYAEISQEPVVLACYLLSASKEGHLCIRIDDDRLDPSVSHIWQNEEGNFLKTEEVSILTEAIRLGIHSIPDDILTKLPEHNQFFFPQTPICQYGNLFYLQKSWVYESVFLKHLQKHMRSAPKPIFDPLLIFDSVNQLFDEKVLLKEQSEAIIQGCLNPLSLVTGGPGTGKTYTAGCLVRIVWQHLSKEERESYEIILTAPTGKAAFNLQKSLRKVTSSLEDFPSVKAKTLHALLGIKPGSHDNEHASLTADLIIVDESSMIDARMMSSLFQALKQGSRVILLGDKNQLPSVEAGSIFSDLIENHSNPNNLIPTTILKVCLRAQLKTLIDFATLVNQGRGVEALNYLNQSNGNGVKRLFFHSEKNKAQREFVKFILSDFPCLIKSECKDEDLLQIFNKMRLLSPVRRGLFGVETLNDLIWKTLTQALPPSGWIAIPILIITNDYRQELFNGETGVVIRRLPLQSVSIEDYAIFPSLEEEGRARRISALLLPKYEWAYCLSVHKSQGSEFDRVLLVLPEGTEHFGREVFYTAITRARNSLEVYGSDEVLLKTVEQRDVRLSGIGIRLSYNAV